MTIKEKIIAALDGANEENLEKALVLVGARYDENGKCTNVQRCDFEPIWDDTSSPAWNFTIEDYQLKPEPKYKPFDAESFLPYRDCWFMRNGSDLVFKVVNYYNVGIAVAMYRDKLASYSWEYFMENFTLDGKPAGVEV